VEFLFEILGELALQLFALVARIVVSLLANCIAEMGWAGFLHTLQRERNPVLSTIGFVIWGALAGAVSLWPFPHLVIANHWLSLANLALTPLACAIAATFVGEKLGEYDSRFIERSRFFYAFALAATMALVRFGFAK